MVIWLKPIGMLHTFCFGLSTITSGRFGTFGADFPDKMLCKLCLVLGCFWWILSGRQWWKGSYHIDMTCRGSCQSRVMGLQSLQVSRWKFLDQCWHLISPRLVQTIGIKPLRRHLKCVTIDPPHAKENFACEWDWIRYFGRMSCFKHMLHICLLTFSR